MGSQALMIDSPDSWVGDNKRMTEVKEWKPCVVIEEGKDRETHVEGEERLDSLF